MEGWKQNLEICLESVAKSSPGFEAWQIPAFGILSNEIIFCSVLGHLELINVSFVEVEKWSNSFRSLTYSFKRFGIVKGGNLFSKWRLLSLCMYFCIFSLTDCSEVIVWGKAENLQKKTIFSCTNLCISISGHFPFMTLENPSSLLESKLFSEYIFSLWAVVSIAYSAE